MSEEDAIKTKRNFKPKLIIPLLIVVVVALLVLFIKNMNGPAEGTVAYKAQSEPSAQPTVTTPKKYDGKYIAFTYPGHYKVVTNPSLSGGYLEVASLDNTDHTGKFISIGVIKESLANDSGVNYRKGHPELYKQIESTPDKIVFVGTGTTAEQTGFIAHNGMVSTISITADGRRDLSEDFNTIVDSLTWKQ